MTIVLRPLSGSNEDLSDTGDYKRGMGAIDRTIWGLIGLTGFAGGALWLYAYWIVDDVYLGSVAIGLLMLFFVSATLGKFIETPSGAA